VPVREVDGRRIGWADDPAHRPVTDRLRALYQDAVDRDVAAATARAAE
jgi:hypothetical protein